MSFRRIASPAVPSRPVSRVWTRVLGRALALALALDTAGCISANGPTPPSLLSNVTDPLSPTRDLTLRHSAPIRQGAPLPAPSRGVVSVGDDLFVADALPQGRLYETEGKSDVTLNLVDVDIAMAAKTVIADILGQNLVVDDRVSGTITLQTIRPISRSALVDMFETVLAAKGFTLVRGHDGYRIADAGTGPGGKPGFSGGMPIGVNGTGMGPGLSAQVIPLRYVSAEDMRSLLGSIAPKETIVAADNARNFIIVSGTRAQVGAILEAVGLFDVDWMRGMSAAIFPLKSSNPAAIAEELDQLFGSAGGPLRGTIKFVPNTHLNAVLVITSRAEYLRRARELIRRLEDMAVQSESQFFVYKVENRSAKDLADVLKGMLSQGGTFGSSSNGLSPKLTPGSTSSPAFGSGSGSGRTGETGAALDVASGSGEGLGSGTQSVTTQPTGDPRDGSGSASASSDPRASDVVGSIGSGRAGTAADLARSGGGEPNNSSLANLSITADDQNNSLIITGTRLQYEKVLRILATLDSPPIQVLLEAVIAEVTLNDELRFGVRWFLTQHHYKLSEADNATSSNATTTLAGLSFAAKLGEIDSLLNTLSSVTDVKVVSTPSLTVLDNHVAHLQVGNEVPIVKQTATNTASNTAATVTDVEYKNTGVILSVTPRVNQNGLVLLDIDQEVSDVVTTTTSSINSPTIQQRKVSTAVIVQDGQTLALGGLVQDKSVDARDRFPLVGRMPVIGPLFGTTENSKARTELMVFVRPRVLRNTNEARQVTDEFRSKLGHLFRPQSGTQWRRDIGTDLERMGH